MDRVSEIVSKIYIKHFLSFQIWSPFQQQVGDELCKVAKKYFNF